MSGVTAATVLAGAAVAGTVATIYNGEEQKRAQKKANSANQANALKTEKQATEATNRANQKAPDTKALLESAAQSGGAGTMLTGPQGVDPNALALGKNTLLGQ